MFEAVRGLPWQLDPMVVAGPGQQVVPTQLHAGPVVADAQLPAQRTEAEWTTMARRVYIRRDVELVKHGFTPGCDGCAVAMSGVGPPMGHSDECRLRIVKAMADDPDGQPRLAAAASRQDTRKRRKPQEHEDASMAAPQPGAATSSSGPWPGPTAGQQPGVATSSSGPRPGPVAGRQPGATTSSSGSWPGPVAGQQPGTAAASSSGPWPGPVAGASVSVPMDTRDKRPRSRDGDGDESRLRDVTDAGAIDEINIVLYSMSTSLVDVSELFNAQVFTTKASSFNLILGTSFDLRGGYDLGDLLVQKSVWANLQEQ